MKEKKLFSKIFSGSFLVSGTAIGAGMLALPIATAQAGFFPALMVYIVCWLFSIITGFLMLEITLNMPEHSNLISMSKEYLGKYGKLAAWILYLFLFYCLTIAYVSGGSSLLKNLFLSNFSFKINLVVFTAIFGGCVLAGTKVVNKINILLMAGLIFSYLSFIFAGSSEVKFERLSYFDFSAAIWALPVIFTSFSYQGIMPTLTDYLQRDRKALRYSIWIGASIPFLAYIVWDMMIKGVVPLQQLIEAQIVGSTAIQPLNTVLKNSAVNLLGQFFGFFALTTSFLGVTLGLLDFLADGLKISKKGFSRFFLCLLIYMPAGIITSINPNVFLSALEYAGGIGCALLLGFIPVCMVYAKRYHFKNNYSNMAIVGEKLFLLSVTLFIIFELTVMILKRV